VVADAESAEDVVELVWQAQPGLRVHTSSRAPSVATVIAPQRSVRSTHVPRAR